MVKPLLSECGLLKAGKLYRAKHHRISADNSEIRMEKNAIMLFLGVDPHIDVSEYLLYFLCEDSKTHAFPIGIEWLNDFFEPI